MLSKEELIEQVAKSIALKEPLHNWYSWEQVELSGYKKDFYKIAVEIISTTEKETLKAVEEWVKNTRIHKECYKCQYKISRAECDRRMISFQCPAWQKFEGES